MARWAWAVATLVASSAGGCSLLVDSDVGVRSDGGGPGDGDGAPDSGDGGAVDHDATDCPPDLVDFPPFSDDFSTDELAWAIDPKIQRDGAAEITAGVSGGVLRFAPAAAGTDNAWVKSVEFEFLEGRIAVRIPSLTTDADTEAYVALLAPGVQHRMRFDGSMLRVPGGSAVAYNGDAHVWWQIRNQENYLHFETSQDGVDFTELDRIPADINPIEVRIEIGISVAAAGEAARGEFAIDDLNLPPCR